MTLRQKARVPLLTWYNWFIAIFNSDTFTLGKPNNQFGSASYVETWITLLQLFGAESIIHSKHTLEHPVNLEALPPGLVNPFVIELKLAILLAGLAGCTSIMVNADANTPLIASCENAVLKFSSAEEMPMIGKFHQRMTYPTYHMYTSSRVSHASVVGMKNLCYTNRLCPTDENDASVQDGLIFDDLRNKCSPCNHDSHPSKENNIGLRVPALALLAANTPPVVRAHPSKHCRIFEAISELAKESSTWRDPRNYTTINFGQQLGWDDSSLIIMTQEEFEKEPFQGDRLTRRVLKIFRETSSFKLLDLGYSWLGSKEEYLAGPDLVEENEIKSRPKWPPDFSSSSFVLIDGVVEGCAKFLSPEPSRPEFDSQDEEAEFHTAASCQLQEVDWWLGNNQAAAAYETCNLLHGISESGQESLAENSGVTPEKSLTTDLLHARVRALLIFRAILIATLFGLALDSSVVEGLYGKQYVLLG
jgi:hypothetical protein